MNPIRVIIVDDEDLARDSLKISLRYFNQLIVIDECANGFDAIKSVKDNKPDVIFLDIQMPKLSGFDVIELLGEESPIVIFVTAYDDYAIQAFEANALDYLLKPVSRERLQLAIERIEEKLSSSGKPDYTKILKQANFNSSPVQRILVKEKDTIHVIPVAEISYFEAQDDYVLIHTSEQSYLKNERLSNLEAELDPNIFLRLHRSFIVNVDCINRIESITKDAKVVKLNGGVEIPVSRSGYEKLKQIL